MNLSGPSCYTPGVGEVCLDRPLRTAACAAPDDAALLAAMARGEGAALAGLYSRHGQALYGYLLRLAGDRGTAEEILQDTLLAACRSAGGFEGRSPVRTWVFGVGRRQALDLYEP